MIDHYSQIDVCEFLICPLPTSCGRLVSGHLKKSVVVKARRVYFNLQRTDVQNIYVRVGQGWQLSCLIAPEVAVWLIQLREQLCIYLAPGVATKVADQLLEG